MVSRIKFRCRRDFIASYNPMRVMTAVPLCWGLQAHSNLSCFFISALRDAKNGIKPIIAITRYKVVRNSFGVLVKYIKKPVIEYTAHSKQAIIFFMISTT